jgi:hypothetical protein
MQNEFLAKVVGYIDSTNTLLEKYAAENTRLTKIVDSFKNEKAQYVEKIAEAVDMLVNDGTIPSDYSDAVLKNLASSPVKAAEFLTKTKNGPVRLGTASAMPSQDQRDAIERFCFED